MEVSDCVVDRMAAVDRMDVAVDKKVVVDTMAVEAVVGNILAVDVVGMAVVGYFELVVVVVAVVRVVRLLNYLSKNQPVGLEKFK